MHCHCYSLGFNFHKVPYPVSVAGVWPLFALCKTRRRSSLCYRRPYLYYLEIFASVSVCFCEWESCDLVFEQKRLPMDSKHRSCSNDDTDDGGFLALTGSFVPMVRPKGLQATKAPNVGDFHSAHTTGPQYSLRIATGREQ